MYKEITKWKSFEGVVKAINQIGHQHLSNIYFYINLTVPEYYDDDTKREIQYELKHRFHGRVLPYRPIKEFKMEIDILKRKNLLHQKKDSSGYDILVGDDWIGEIEGDI